MAIKKLECSMQVAIFCLYLISCFTLIFSIKNNSWLDIQTNDKTYQVGLNDNCELLPKSIRCVSWSDSQDKIINFPIDEHPPIFLKCANVLKWVLLIVITLCIACCISFFCCSKKAVDEVIPKPFIAAYLMIGLCAYILVLLLICVCRAFSSIVFHWNTTSSHQVMFGSAYILFSCSAIAYALAILLYYLLLKYSEPYNMVNTNPESLQMT